MDAASPATVADNLRMIQARIVAATQASGRPAGCVTLVAVSKTHTSVAIQAAREAGQEVFGENRVQEAVAKFSSLQPAGDCRVHLIGSLQTNKAQAAVAIAHMIEVLDRPSLADALAHAADRTGRLPELLVQINLGDEPQKSGVARADADVFIRACAQRFGKNLRGVMGIPPAGLDPDPYFRLLAEHAVRHGLPVVSMGMSADFEQAIACGATMVRVGSAIFGGRG